MRPSFNDLVWQLGQVAPQGDVPSSQDRARGDYRELEARLDKMTLIAMAMWSLLSEKAGVSEADLLQRIEEIDLMDGKLDGKLTRSPVTCPKCKCKLHPKHTVCIYCETPCEEGPPEGFSAFDGAL